MTELSVSGLAIHPIKSCAQVTLDHTLLDRFGLLHDRRWMVVDVSGRFLTQRQQPRMCQVQPGLHGDALQLHAPGMPSLVVSTPSANRKMMVSVWNDHCKALDAGDAAAAWLRRFLSIDCRLVFFPDDEVRLVDPTYGKPGDQTAFSDGFPLLLTTQASLDDLNARLDAPISMQRFRANLVVEGCEAFAEDTWRRLRIGGLTLRVVKPCSRCAIPNIDPATGQRDVEPTRTLSSYRQRDNKIYFGQNVIIEGSGELAVGMSVEVLE